MILTGDHRGQELTEKEIYSTLLGHTPADKVDAFKQVYKRQYGETPE
jgi:hypothetical protein